MITKKHTVGEGEGIAFLEGNQIVDANEQFAILFGWKELPIGEDILSLVDPRDWQRLGARKFARSRVELQGRTQQGSTKHEQQAPKGRVTSSPEPDWVNSASEQSLNGWRRMRTSTNAQKQTK